MGRLLGFVLVVAVVGGVVAELVAPAMIESRVEERVTDRTDDRARVDAEVGGFPLLPRLLVEGELDWLTVTLHEVAGQEVTFGHVEVHVEGIRLDRDAMFRGQVQVRGISSGFVEIEIADDRLGALSDAGEELGIDAAEVRDRVVELAADHGESLDVPIPEELLPCDPDVVIEDELVRLSCEIDELPPVLARGGSAG